MVLFTAGYEFRTIDDFVERLKHNKIDVLVDVRELPLSRKKGFSKSCMRNKLEEENIEYVHLRELGSPRDIRHELRASGNYAHFFQRYRDHLQGHKGELEHLIHISKEQIACIMCYEQEPEKCHRSIIIDELFEMESIEVRHI